MICKATILKHVPLANVLAAMYAKDHPAERDEILSAAYYGLVLASRKPATNTAYIACCIRTRIRDALERAHSTLHEDRVFLADYLSQQGNMEERAAAMGLPPDFVFHRLANMTIVLPLQQDQDIHSKSESQLEEVLEVCLTYLPERIRRSFLLRFRDQYTWREIAKLVGITRGGAINHTRTAIGILREHRQQLAEVLF
jgi:RNA polymerase sigma factor (sigma-70 family)